MNKTVWLNFTNGDLIEYNGVFYGDFTIFAGEDMFDGTVRKISDKRWTATVTQLGEIPQKYFG
jgi:hypothetical protein